MLIDKKTKRPFTIGTITGNNAQAVVIISTKDKSHFPKGTRVEIYPLNSDTPHTVRKVYNQSTDGRSHVVTIPTQDRDFFQIGMKVRIFKMNVEANKTRNPQNEQPKQSREF